jgi:hypothetical protein
LGGNEPPNDTHIARFAPYSQSCRRSDFPADVGQESCANSTIQGTSKRFGLTILVCPTPFAIWGTKSHLADEFDDLQSADKVWGHNFVVTDDRNDRARSRGIAESEPAVAAADLENTCAVEASQRPKSRHLGLWIDHARLESQLDDLGLPVISRFQSLCPLVHRRQRLCMLERPKH